MINRPVYLPGELREEAEGRVLRVHDATEQVQPGRDRAASGARTELWEGLEDCYWLIERG